MSETLTWGSCEARIGRSMSVLHRPHPTPVDECCDRLRRAGWSFGWCSVARPGEGERILVDGTNGENALGVEAATLAEALRLACGQARAIGTLAPAAERERGKR